MAKGKRNGVLDRFLRRSEGGQEEADPWANYHEELDEETLRDLESSITPRAGLAYLAGQRLTDYETRLKALEEILLRTATIPPEAAVARGAQIAPPTPAIAVQVPAAPAGDDDEVSASGSFADADADACEPAAGPALEDADQVPVPATPDKLLSRERSTLGDLSFLPAGIDGGGVDRLEPGEKTPWSFARVPLLLVRRSRSAGDMAQMDAVKGGEGGGVGRLEATRAPWWARRGLARRGSVGELQHVGALGKGKEEGGLNRLETSVSGWAPALKRSRSAGDGLEAEAVARQDVGDVPNRLETEVSAWKAPRIERSRSQGDLLEAPAVAPQGAGEGLNRLETSVSAWTTPRRPLRPAEENSIKPVARVAPAGLEEAGSLNRLQTSVWQWTHKQPKNGSDRALRTRKILRLGHPAPGRYRGTFKRPHRRPPRPPPSVADSFDSSLRELMTPSPGGSTGRRRWTLKGIDQCSPDEAASRLGDGSSTLGSLGSGGRSERSVVLSTREVRATSEPARGAQYSDDDVTRLIADEPLFRFVINEEEAPD